MELSEMIEDIAKLEKFYEYGYISLTQYYEIKSKIVDKFYEEYKNKKIKE